MARMKLIPIAAVTLLLLTGCTNANPATAYLQTARDEYPQLEQIDDETLINLAEGICADLDAGRTAEDVRADLATDDDPVMMGFLAGAGAKAYCPEHFKELTS